MFIHESAEIEDSTIGPYASIGAECKIIGSRIEDSIIEAECEIKNAALKSSIVGKQAKVAGACPAKAQGSGANESFKLNIGDNSSVILGQ